MINNIKTSFWNADCQYASHVLETCDFACRNLARGLSLCPCSLRGGWGWGWQGEGGGGVGGCSGTYILIVILLNKNWKHCKQHDVLIGSWWDKLCCLHKVESDLEETLQGMKKYVMVWCSWYKVNILLQMKTIQNRTKFQLWSFCRSLT